LSYQISIFIIVGGLITLFFAVIQMNYISLELNVKINGINYFKFLKEIPREKKLEIILPSLAFITLFIFNFEDILWFRLFYGPNMSQCIDNLYERMVWLDFHMAGLVGRIMGFNGAITLSVMITSAIGYFIFCLFWYKLLQEKYIFIHLLFCIFFIFGLDIVFCILTPPFPYIRISLMGILFFATFIFIVVKNTR
ncbi:MAG: hypothetical protein ACTSQG_08300, partial [Promethearchaeota archaeon]